MSSPGMLEDLQWFPCDLNFLHCSSLKAAFILTLMTRAAGPGTSVRATHSLARVLKAVSSGSQSSSQRRRVVVASKPSLSGLKIRMNIKQRGDGISR